jgi:hypothetical protein
MHGGRGLVGEGDRGVGEPGGGQSVEVFGAGQGAGDAAGVGPGRGPVRGRQVVFGDNITDADPAAGHQDPEHLGEDRCLAGGQVDHVDAIGKTRRADPAGGQQHVDTATRSQVQDPLSLVQADYRQRVAAAEACQDGVGGEPVCLVLAVQGFAEAADRITLVANLGYS